MTREFLGLRARDFQDVFIWTKTYSEIFKFVLVYL